MIKWTKLPKSTHLLKPSDNIYIIPCDGGSEIYYDDEKCFVEDATVLEIVDKFNAIGCTSFRLSKEDIEKALEQFNKEN